jgi:hypothetical protein
MNKVRVLSLALFLGFLLLVYSSAFAVKTGSPEANPSLVAQQTGSCDYTCVDANGNPTSNGASSGGTYGDCITQATAACGGSAYSGTFSSGGHLIHFGSSASKDN